MDIGEFREYLKKIVTDGTVGDDVKADRLVVAAMRLCSVELGGGAKSMAERFPRADKKLRRLIDAMELRAREWRAMAQRLQAHSELRAQKEQPRVVTP